MLIIYIQYMYYKLAPLKKIKGIGSPLSISAHIDMVICDHETRDENK